MAPSASAGIATCMTNAATPTRFHSSAKAPTIQTLAGTFIAFDKSAALAAATHADPRGAAVQARAARADGTFFYSVRTTGVYCRPSCGAGRAAPGNGAKSEGRR